MKLPDIKNSNTLRILFIGFLILLLLVPMGMVESVIVDRGYLYRQANDEITASWGREQLLAGPILTLPYIETLSQDTGRSYETRYKHLRPAAMVLNTSIDIQTRYRSIYKVPVYTAAVLVHGRFMLAEAALEEEGLGVFALEKGLIQIPLSSSRAIKEPVHFFWDGEEIALRPHFDKPGGESVILSAELPAAALDKETVHTFELRLKLAGSNELAFISSSQHTIINLDANWGSPGFFGIYLPSSYEINEDVFTAMWEINDLLTDIGHSESERVSYKWFTSPSRFGARFVQPVDTYQSVTRAAKYAVLFIGLTFLVYFFTEILGKVSLHPVQYLLVGVANCIFYLLLLSLAEHISFNMAYWISTCASISLISLYSLSILGSRSKAAVVMLVLSGLYTYLFVTLRSEAYALLIGSIGLFVILAVVMYLTRNIDWRRTGDEVRV